MADVNAYKAIIAELEDEVAGLEMRLSDTRALLARIQERFRRSKNGGSKGANRHVAEAIAVTRLAEDVPRTIQAEAFPIRMVGTRPQSKPTFRRGDTTGTVLAAVERSEGRTAAEYANELADQIQQGSAARDPRKLVHSTLGYLRKIGRVRRDEHGRYYLMAAG